MELTKIRTLHQNFLGYEVILVKTETLFVALASMQTGTIYVTNLFLQNFSTEEQTAILGHEVGHLILHTSQTRERNTVEELEADRFSAENIGLKPMMNALKKSIALLRTKKTSADTEKYFAQMMEYRHRISNLLDFAGGKNTTLTYFKDLS